MKGSYSTVWFPATWKATGDSFKPELDSFFSIVLEIGHETLGHSGKTYPVQGYLFHKKTLSPLGTPSDPRYSPTVGSFGVAVSYVRGTPVSRILLSGRPCGRLLSQGSTG